MDSASVQNDATSIDLNMEELILSLVCGWKIPLTKVRSFSISQVVLEKTKQKNKRDHWVSQSYKMPSVSLCYIKLFILLGGWIHTDSLIEALEEKWEPGATDNQINVSGCDINFDKTVSPFWIRTKCFFY